MRCSLVCTCGIKHHLSCTLIIITQYKNSFDRDKKKIPIVKLNRHGNIFSQKKTSTYNLSVVDSKNVQSLNKLTQKSEH